MAASEETPGLDVEIGITLTKLTKQLAAAEARFAKTAKDYENKFKVANDNVAVGYKKSGAAAEAFAKGGLRNVTEQLSQVAQQGAVTGDYLKALAFQLPDIGLSFGTIGIVAGAAAGVLVPLALNLLEAGGKAKSLADTTKDLESTVNALNAANRDAAQSTSELTKQYGDQVGQARDLLKIKADLAKVDAASALQEAQSKISQQFGDVGLGTAKQFEEIGKQLDKGIGGSLIDPTAFSVLVPTIENIKDKLGISAEEAGKLAGAFGDVGRADTLDGAIAALDKARGLFVQIVGTSGKLSADNEQLLRSMISASLAALDIKTNTDSAAGAIAEATSKADQLADAMKRASDAATSIGKTDTYQRKEAELRLKHKADPKALAGALAGLQFDNQVGDTSAYDPILKEQLAKQRQAHIDNAEATEADRQALAQWNREQQSAAHGGTKQLSDMQRQAAQVYAQTRTQAEQYAVQVGKLDQLHNAGLISQDTYDRALKKLQGQYSSVGQAATFFRNQGQDLQNDFLNWTVGLGHLSDGFLGIAQSIAKAAEQAVLFGEGPLASLFGTSIASGGTGGLFAGLGSLLSFRANGGPVTSGQP
ncbi:hypothetical protein FGG78_28850, partial [Thioclava sp. BHET1]